MIAFAIIQLGLSEFESDLLRLKKMKPHMETAIWNKENNGGKVAE